MNIKFPKQAWISEEEYNEISPFEYPTDNKKPFAKYEQLARTHITVVSQGGIEMTSGGTIADGYLETTDPEDKSLYLTEYHQDVLKLATSHLIEAYRSGWKPYFEMVQDFTINNGSISNTQSSFKYEDMLDALPKVVVGLLRKIDFEFIISTNGEFNLQIASDDYVKWENLYDLAVQLSDEYGTFDWDTQREYNLGMYELLKDTVLDKAITNLVEVADTQTEMITPVFEGTQQDTNRQFVQKTNTNTEAIQIVADRVANVVEPLAENNEARLDIAEPIIEGNRVRSLGNEASIIAIENNIGEGGVYQTNSSIVSILTTPTYIKPDITKNITNTTILDIDETNPVFTKYIVKVNDANVEVDLVGALLKVGSNDTGTINLKISSNNTGFVYYDEDLVYDFVGSGSADIIAFNERIRFKIDDTRPENEELFFTFSALTASDIVDVQEKVHIDIVVKKGGTGTGGTITSDKVIDTVDTLPTVGSVNVRLKEDRDRIIQAESEIETLETTKVDKTDLTNDGILITSVDENNSGGQVKVDSTNRDVVLSSWTDGGDTQVNVRVNQNAPFIEQKIGGVFVEYEPINDGDIPTKKYVDDNSGGTGTPIRTRTLIGSATNISTTTTWDTVLSSNWDTYDDIELELIYDAEPSDFTGLDTKEVHTIHTEDITVNSAMMWGELGSSLASTGVSHFYAPNNVSHSYPTISGTTIKEFKVWGVKVENIEDGNYYTKTETDDKFVETQQLVSFEKILVSDLHPTDPSRDKVAMTNGFQSSNGFTIKDTTGSGTSADIVAFYLDSLNRKQGSYYGVNTNLTNFATMDDIGIMLMSFSNVMGLHMSEEQLKEVYENMLNTKKTIPTQLERKDWLKGKEE